MTDVRAKGAFDANLFRAYRAAEGVTRSRLEGRLLVDNEPLVKKLVAQFRGEDPSAPRRGCSKANRLPGVEHVDWEECMAAGMTGLLKALRGLDLDKGGLTILAKWKIQNELQTIIDKSQVVTSSFKRNPPGRPTGFDFLDGEEFDRALGDDAEVLDGFEAVEFDARPEAPAPPPLESRPALEEFLERRLAWGPALRVAREPLVATFERFARARHVSVSVRQFGAAIRARGARAVWMRVPWAPSVRGFAGMRVQSESHQTA